MAIMCEGMHVHTRVCDVIPLVYCETCCSGPECGYPFGTTMPVFGGIQCWVSRLDTCCFPDWRFRFTDSPVVCKDSSLHALSRLLLSSAHGDHGGHSAM